MKWKVGFHEDFYPVYLELGIRIKHELLVRVKLLQECGPLLDRP